MTQFQAAEHPLEQVNDSAMTRTVKGMINFWNRSAEKLYGWRKEEAVGRISHDLLKTQFPKPLEEIEHELVRNGQWEGKLVHTTRYGRRVTVHSRWVLDANGQPGTVLEINAYSSGSEGDNKPPSKVVVFADVTLAAGICVCLAAFFYFIYFYNVSDTRSFISFAGVILYQILPAVVAVLLLAALWLPATYRINVALVLCSMGVSLYGAELVATLSSSMSSSSVTLWDSDYLERAKEKEIIALAKTFNRDFDTRSKLEVITDLRKQGIQAVPTIIPEALLEEKPDGSVQSAITINGEEVLPLGGISNRTTVLCNETGTYGIYDSDERGFHNPKGIWRSSRIAIAAVGDSFTQGACVSSDKNFVTLIRNRYSGTLNLGMAGEGPMIMLAALKEYLPLLKPNVVLWFFYEGNDFVDLSTEGRTRLLRNYLQDDFKQGLFDRQADIDGALSAYVENVMKAELAKKEEEAKNNWYSRGALQRFLKLGDLRQRLGLVYGKSVQAPEMDKFGEYAEPQLDLFRSALLEAKKEVGTWGGTVYFVYLPARDRYVNSENYNREAILSIVREVDLPIIDLHESFQRQGDPLRFFPFRRFGHYNEAGNRLVAEEVLRSIAPHP